jgi:predicted small metal-binding protein
VQLSTTTPEQRSAIYDDVRSLIAPGFLIHHVSVNGSRFVLRSLSDDDWLVLRTRTWGAPVKEWKAWMVSSSIWMVDGQIVLGEDETSYRLFEMCLSMPDSVLEDFEMIVSALMKRLTEAAQVVEAFMYEDESRLLWKSHGGAKSDSYFHGRQIGANAVRRIWSYFNDVEDQREHNDYLWSIAKFEASPHAPKGVKKLQAQDQNSKSEEKRSRQKTQDRIYYEAMGLVAKLSSEERREGRRGPWQDVYMAETADELQEVMRRWVEGIKDDHDNVVDGAKARIKHDVEQRKLKSAAQRKALSAALEEEGIAGSKMVPIAGQAGQAFLDRVSARIPGTSKVLQDNSHNSAYDKYIAQNPEVGNLVVDEQGRVMSTQPADPEMVNLMLRPDEGGEPTLQEKIAKRRPTAEFFDDGEGGS